MARDAERRQRGGIGRRRGRVARALLLASLLVPCTGAKLVDVRSARHADFTRIVFETDEKISYAIENLSQGSERSVELSLPAAATETIVRAVHEPAISVEVESRGAGSRAVVRVAEPVDVYTNYLKNPPRVVLDLRVAEAVGDRDPERLDALDYQIVIEANPDRVDAAPTQTAAVSTAVDAHPVAVSEPPRERSTGWARSAAMWWTLAAIGLLFLVVLYLQRLSQRRRRQERAAAASRRPRTDDIVARERRRPERSRREEVLGGSTHGAASGPTAEPAADRPAPAPNAPGSTGSEAGVEIPEETAVSESKTIVVEEPILASELVDAGGEDSGASAEPASREFFTLFAQMEERLALLERDLRETRAEGRELRERSAAQAEELRAHRAAMTRLLRRGRGVQAHDTVSAPRLDAPSSS